MALTKKVHSDAYANLIDLIYDKPNAFAGALMEAIEDGELDNYIRKIAKTCFMRRHTLEETGVIKEVPTPDPVTDQDGMVPLPNRHGIIPKIPYGERAGGRTVMKIGSNRYYVDNIVGMQFQFPSVIRPQALAGIRAEIRQVDIGRNALGVVLLTSPNRRGNYYNAYANGDIIWTRMVPSNPLRTQLFEQ